MKSAVIILTTILLGMTQAEPPSNGRYNRLGGYRQQSKSISNLNRGYRGGQSNGQRGPKEVQTNVFIFEAPQDFEFDVLSQLGGASLGGASNSYGAPVNSPVNTPVNPSTGYTPTEKSVITTFIYSSPEDLDVNSIPNNKYNQPSQYSQPIPSYDVTDLFNENLIPQTNSPEYGAPFDKF